jgi:hypothetical protein
MANRPTAGPKPSLIEQARVQLSGQLLAMFDLAVEERFLKPENRGLVLAWDSVAQLLQALAEWRPVRVEKWLDRNAT